MFTKSKKPAQAIQSAKIFNEFVFKLFQMKKEHPDNKIIKDCLSGVWGRLCEINKSYRNAKTKGDIVIEDDEIFNEVRYSDDKNMEFTTTKKSNPYTTNFARLKSFLWAKLRLDMYERVIEKYKNTHKFLRIMIDGFIVDKPIKEFDDSKKFLHMIVKEHEYHNFHTPNKTIVCPNKNGDLCKECKKKC
jgi:hypothetical protein